MKAVVLYRNDPERGLTDPILEPGGRRFVFRLVMGNWLDPLLFDEDGWFGPKPPRWFINLWMPIPLPFIAFKWPFMNRQFYGGAKIYGEVKGYGATSDGHDMVAPSGEGAERCMRLALKGFDGKAVSKIDYINPHGTSTPVGDAKEIDAIRAVFGNAIPPISATKSLTGHSLGAIGVQEAIFSLLMMNNGFICESANIEELDPAFADVPIALSRIDNAELNCVMSNSFGFGGTNATLIFGRHDA